MKDQLPPPRLNSNELGQLRSAKACATQALQAQMLRHVFSRPNLTSGDQADFCAAIDAYDRKKPMLGEAMIRSLVGNRWIKPVNASLAKSPYARIYALTPLGCKKLPVAGSNKVPSLDVTSGEYKLSKVRIRSGSGAAIQRIRRSDAIRIGPTVENIGPLSKNMKAILARERAKNDNALRERLFKMFSPRSDIRTTATGPSGERLIILLVLAEEGFAQWVKTKSLAGGEEQLIFHLTEAGLTRREKFWNAIGTVPSD